MALWRRATFSVLFCFVLNTTLHADPFTGLETFCIYLFLCFFQVAEFSCLVTVWRTHFDAGGWGWTKKTAGNKSIGLAEQCFGPNWVISLHTGKQLQKESDKKVWILKAWTPEDSSFKQRDMAQSTTTHTHSWPQGKVAGYTGAMVFLVRWEPAWVTVGRVCKEGGTSAFWKHFHPSVPLTQVPLRLISQS